MHDPWAYVIPSYVLALVLLGGLTVFIVAQLRRWAKKARVEEDQ